MSDPLDPEIDRALAARPGARAYAAAVAELPAADGDSYYGDGVRRFETRPGDRLEGDLAPEAVGRLEQGVSGTEIVRFPGSPYEIVRAYWEAQVRVRGRLESGLDAALRSAAALVPLLRALHVTALGGDGGEPYRPSSRIAGARALVPGALLHEPAVVDGTRFVSGPRVNVEHVGGARYHALLAESLDEPGHLAPELVLEHGRVVTARAAGDERPRAWFVPERPLSIAGFDVLRLAIREGRLAEAHRTFVQMHPFAAANQSLAMAIVERSLRAEHGAGMPHLILDHLALRLSLGAYERLFARARAAWIVPGSPLERWNELRRRRDALFRTWRAIEEAGSDAAARALLDREPLGARLALLAG